MIGRAVEDYLKCIYQLSLEYETVAPGMVAERFQISPAAVTKMVKRLKELKLLKNDGKRGLVITPSGKKIALDVLRRHRLLESFLYKTLGYTWDQVHDEAERLEHVVSKTFVEKIDALLGRPARDPHGAPIPRENGKMDCVRYPTLDEMEPGVEATVRQVSKDDAAMLRYMGDLGLYPGTDVTVISKEPYGGPMYVLVSGKKRAIGLELARNLMVLEKEMVE